MPAHAILELDHVHIVSPIADDEVKPGDRITIEFDVNNPTKEDLRSTTATVAFRHNDGGFLTDEKGDQLELRRDLGTIRSNNDQHVELSFRVPYTVHDRDNYTMDLTVTTRTANRTVETVENTNEEFIIKKLPHDLTFESLVLTPTAARCGDRALLNLIVRNIGNANEDAALDVTGKELGISSHDAFLLNADYKRNNSFIRPYIFTIPTIVSGTYMIAARLGFNKQEIVQNVSLQVVCNPLPAPTQQQTQKETQQETQQETGQKTESELVEPIPPIPAQQATSEQVQTQPQEEVQQQPLSAQSQQVPKVSQPPCKADGCYASDGSDKTDSNAKTILG